MKFVIENFGIIKKADFTIDGITIIAAPNDCGKTSALRSLFVLNDTFSSTNFHHIQKQYLQNVMREAVSEDKSLRKPYNVIIHSEEFLKDIISLISKDSEKLRNKMYKQFEEIYIEYQNQFEFDFEDSSFSEKLAGKKNNRESTRQEIKKFIDAVLAKQKLNTLEPIEYLLNFRLKAVLHSLSAYIKGKETSLYLEVDNQKLGFIRKEINSKTSLEFPVDESDTTPTVYFEEISMVGKHLNPTSSFRRPSLSPYLAKLIKAIKADKEINTDFYIDKFSKIDFSPYHLVKNEESHHFYFSKNSHSGQIEVNNTPKGVLLISYLRKIIENGNLKKGSMLIIDEPETHLHQNWQALLAKYLYTIYSVLDVKIVLATHSPVLVEAFEALKQLHNVEDIRFYSGIKNQDGLVSYTDCTDDTSHIYESYMSGFRVIDEFSN